MYQNHICDLVLGTTQFITSIVLHLDDRCYDNWHLRRVQIFKMAGLIFTLKLVRIVVLGPYACNDV